MIYDTLDHLSSYEGLHPGVLRGLRYLAETDFTGMAAGRLEFENEQCFAILQRYITRPANDTPEAHRSYIDIQYLVEGTELVGIAPLENMEQEVEAHPDRDLWLYRGPVSKLPLGGQRFLVLFPQDAHAPCIAAGKPSPVCKIVVKVPADPQS